VALEDASISVLFTSICSCGRYWEILVFQYYSPVSVTGKYRETLVFQYYLPVSVALEDTGKH
jgi:hypothetical protein